MRKLFLIAILSAHLASGQAIFRALLGQTTQGCVLPSTTGFAGIWDISTSAICSGSCAGGSNVTSVSDTGPAGNTLTAGTAGTFVSSWQNGLPALNFDGSSVYYTIGGGSPTPQTGSITIFFVGQLNSIGAKGVISSQATAGSFAYYFPYVASTTLQGADQDLVAPIGGGSSAADTSPHQINVVWTDGVSAVFRKDRASDGSASGTGINITQAIAEIGRDQTGGSGQYGNYKLGFLAIYNGAASGTIVSNWEAYKHCKWNL